MIDQQWLPPVVLAVAFSCLTGVNSVAGAIISTGKPYYAEWMTLLLISKTMGAVFALFYLWRRGGPASSTGSLSIRHEIGRWSNTPRYVHAFRALAFPAMLHTFSDQLHGSVTLTGVQASGTQSIYLIVFVCAVYAIYLLMGIYRRSKKNGTVNGDIFDDHDLSLGQRHGAKAGAVRAAGSNIFQSMWQSWAPCIYAAIPLQSPDPVVGACTVVVSYVMLQGSKDVDPSPWKVLGMSAVAMAWASIQLTRVFVGEGANLQHVGAHPSTSSLVVMFAVLDCLFSWAMWLISATIGEPALIPPVLGCQDRWSFGECFLRVWVRSASMAGGTLCWLLCLRSFGPLCVVPFVTAAHCMGSLVGSMVIGDRVPMPHMWAGMLSTALALYALYEHARTPPVHLPHAPLDSDRESDVPTSAAASPVGR